MAIDFKKYVNITSGVGGNSGVPNRALLGRLFTTSPLIPVDTILEFTSAADVSAYFGSTSVEYARAVMYFSWVSKDIKSPQRISFARWSNTATAPYILGAKLATTLAQFQAITDGSVSLTMGAITSQLVGLDFSAATTLANVAAIIQTTVRARIDPEWATATVVYEPIRGSLNLVGGVAAPSPIATNIGQTGTNILDIMGWNADNGAILSNGDSIETITDVLTSSTAVSSNFGSFIFVPTLTLSQMVEAATWNATQNVAFQYYPAVATANINTYQLALAGINGVGITEANISAQFPEMIPMCIMASTDYNGVNSVQNYMYQQSPSTDPSVTDTVTSNAYDQIRVNYVGVTQTAGANISFYQRGLLQGGATSPADMNTYANEQWLKDNAAAALMNLLLAVKVSANTKGRAQIMTVLQKVTITQALRNGTISVGKALTVIQQLYIEQITNDDNAWFQVQNLGYWLGCQIVPVVTQDQRTEYQAVYTLVYSKDDVVRSIVGTHVLI